MRLKNILHEMLIFFLGLLSPIFIWPVKIPDHYMVTLYREPKLYLIGALAWLIFTIGKPQKSIIAAGLSCMCLVAFFSIFWAPVKEAVLYEIFQYVNLIALSTSLTYYFSHSNGRSLFIYGLTTGMAIAISIGLCQWLGYSFTVLKPIGIIYSSTFGARHSAALAVCGSMFLTLVPLPSLLKREKYFTSFFLILLFLLQLFYILILGSKTAYFALLMGSLASTIIGTKYFDFGCKKLVILGAIIFVFIAASYTLTAKNNYVINRLAKTFSFFKKPTTFFQTERWIWWKNSLQMLKANPFGVGAGNWGFMYPVYRKSGKFIYFTEQTQVRRTHNDYLQILCELGPFGILSFLFIFGKSFKYSWHTFYKQKSIDGAFIFIQLITWAGLMCFDYPFEMPFQRFLLIIIMLFAEGNHSEIHT